MLSLLISCMVIANYNHAEFQINMLNLFISCMVIVNYNSKT